MYRKLFKRQWLFITAAAIFSFFAFRQDPQDNAFEIAKNIDIFTTLYKEVNHYYVDDVNPNQVMKTAIDGMLRSLDPYTNYIPEDLVEDYRTITTGEYGGIGALVVTREGRILISMPYKDLPAQKAGLKIGDEILQIDGVKVGGKNNNDVSRLLKGQADTEVKLIIKRPGESQTREVAVKRTKIKIPNVPYYGMVTEDIGYIQLADFSHEAHKEVKDALEELKGKGAKSMILDVRGNLGGLLNEAINICNIFIPKGVEVVSTKGKIADWNKTYRSLNTPTDTEIPLVVLTNNRSASAAEIVSGVIQDYDRGVLIGQRTFGKGLVQTTVPLSYNSRLKVTTAKYYIPSGRCIQAIDYSSRDENGAAARIPDSLRRAFKTKGGRQVYDGAGLEPDLILEPLNLAPITSNLINKGLLFDYANEFALKNASIAPTKSFKLTDAQYQEFLNWLKGKNYDYTTSLEKKFEEVIEASKEDKSYEQLQTDFNVLKKRLSHNKEADLQTFKKEIKEALEEEIVSRYYFEKGAIESTFDNDAEINEAIKILRDPQKYKQILIKK